MIALEGITLPDLIRSVTGAAPVKAVTETAMDGTPIIWEQSSVGGTLIDLLGGNDSGWIDKSTLDSLWALASVARAVYSLVYEGTTYTVRFRHENHPVIEADPVVGRPNPEGTDNYNNVWLKLMEV
jgi:hypothetical protein